MGIDVIVIIIAVVLALLGLLLGFGRTLKFFTSGIFGIVISVFVCMTFGGMVLGIPAVHQWMFDINMSLGGFLQTIHLETIIFYIVFFIVVQIVRIIIVRLVAGLFSASVLPVRIINRVLGMVLMVAAVFLLLLLVFALIHLLAYYTNPSIEMKLLEKIHDSFLYDLYLNNPVKLVPDGTFLWR